MLILRKRIAPDCSSHKTVILALLPLYAVSIAFFGERIAVMGLTAVFSGIVVEYLCLKLFKLRKKRGDYSTVISSLIYTLMLPASAPYWIIAVGIAVMIPVAKYCFGGSGYNIFNPAAVGFALASVCWPGIVFSYPSLAEKLPVIGAVDVSAIVSPGAKINAGGVPYIGFLNIITGQYAGAIGATSVITLSLCFIFLLVTKRTSIWIPLGALIPVFFSALLFPRVSVSFFSSLIFEVISEAFIFGLVFLVHDPVTSSRKRLGKIYFGLFLGILTMIFRHLGKSEGCFVYALLIANCLSHYFDTVAVNRVKKIRNWLKSNAISIGQQVLNSEE